MTQRSRKANSRAEDIPGLLRAANDCLKVARRNRKPLDGNNSYAYKFQDLKAKSILLLKGLQERLTGNGNKEVQDAVAEIAKQLDVFFTPTTTERPESQKKILFLYKTVIEPALAQTEEPIVLVDPEHAVSAVVSLHGFLANLCGTVRICDPYLDAVTLEHLDSCPASSEIRLLTKNVHDSGLLRRVYAAALAQGRPIAVRIAGRAVLHDRYIIDDTTMMVLGVSLNGFGKKQSFVTRAGGDVRAVVLAAFDGIWATATPWP